MAIRLNLFTGNFETSSSSGGGGGGTWGSITGTLSNQTDLQSALNAKENAFTPGNLTDTGTDGIAITGGTGAVVGTGTTIAQHVADVTHNGYLTAADWATFNSKISGNQTITISGDASGSGATSITLTLLNIPDLVTQAGSILVTDIAAPAAPAAGHLKTYGDSTDLRFHDKNAAGTIGTTVVSDTGAAHNFLTAISPAGVISKAQPSFSDLLGSVAAAQMPALTGDVTTSAGSVATTISASIVTYAKIQNVSANSRLLGSNATGGGAAPSEISLGTNLSMSGSVLNSADAAQTFQAVADGELLARLNLAVLQ